MKKIFILCIAVSMLTAIGCKKCATCTKTDYDGEVKSEFCGKGHIYKDQLETHEKAGYTCTE